MDINIVVIKMFRGELRAGTRPLYSDELTFRRFAETKTLRKFAEGYRGTIYVFEEKGKKYAVKTVEDERLLKALHREMEILKFLNAKGFNFVPKLVLTGKDFFVYEFIEGVPLKILLKKEPPLLYLRKILISAYCLDIVGVFKDEFQRPYTNVLVRGRRIFLLDFERGRLNKFYKNVPQYLQFLTAMGILDRNRAVELGKAYKKSPKRVIKEILRSCRI
jgi:putative serine/threonine protein kinase